MAVKPSERLLKNIALLMADKGISQVELARRMNKGQSWVSQLLGKKRDTDSENMERLARALEVEVERLWLPDAGFGVTRKRPRQEELSPPLRSLLEQCEQLDDEGVERLREQAEFLINSGRYRRIDARPTQKRGR
jgi:transcriptional regulator with XRE-family HTH domain